MKRTKAILALTALLLLPAAALARGSRDTTTTSAGLARFDQLEMHATAGASSVTVQVDRVDGSTGSVSVKYTIAAGTAVAGHDFTLTSGQLAWADGDATPKTFSIAVAPTANSAGKTVYLGLYDPFGGLTTDPATRYATLILAGGSSGNPGAARFDQAEFHATAGATSVSIQIDRIGGSTGAVYVKLATLAGTAISGTDYTPQTSGIVTWADGDAAAKTISVAVNPTANSAGKTVLLTLYDPAGGLTLDPTLKNATLILAGASTGNPGIVRFDQAEFHAAAGATSATIQVDRTGGATGLVSVKYGTTAGTATPGSDYTQTSGVLTWGDGDTAPKTFSVPVSPTANSAGKTVVMGLYDPLGGVTVDTALYRSTLILAGSGGGGGGHAGSIGFDLHDYVALAAAGKAVITVQRSDGQSGAVAITYSTQDGTGMAGRDYTPAFGTLQWNDGETGLKTFFVPLLANATSSTVKLALGNPLGGATITQEHGTAVLYISGHTGGGGGAGTINFTAPYFQIVAGSPATVTVARSGGHAGAVSVQYSTGDGSGVAGTDYTPASGTLTWGPDEQGSKTFQVSTAANTSGSGKSVRLTLSNPTGGATLGDGKTSTLYVLSTHGDTSSCVDDDTTLCVAGGRFKVQVTWRTGQGQTGPGHSTKLNVNSGAFWFFSADNTEMLVKVLDACNAYNHFWVFYAATTDVGFTVEVTDTHTGLVKQYSNPYGLAAPSVNDTSTFICH